MFQEEKVEVEFSWSTTLQEIVVEDGQGLWVEHQLDEH
jgi:hypothetical protein